MNNESDESLLKRHLSVKLFNIADKVLSVK